MTDPSNEGTGLRSRMLGGIRASDEGASIALTGWIHRRRDLGGLVFLDLRDRSGFLQVSFGPEWTEADSLLLAHRVGHEDVIRVEGQVATRPADARNPEMATGDVEFRAVSLTLLNEAATPVIPVYRAPDEELPAEELRLRHRVLDLRRAELQRSLTLRHQLVLAARNYMDSQGFLEVETPILTKPTPEGARDFLVPSRVHPGEFFALPQSPQLYKQLLMAAGFDRYFQIARCFRDEDLRADRQPEFTQIDIEASFVEPEDIYGWLEGLMATLGEVGGMEVATPFPRITHRESMERYGSDRPDVRFDLHLEDWTEALSGLDFQVLRGAVESGGRIRGLRVPGGGELSRKDIDALEGVAKETGAPGLMWVKRNAEGGSGPLSRFAADEDLARIGLEVGDLALVAAGPDGMTLPALGAVRSAVAGRLDLVDETRSSWLWVTDFPLFERDAKSGGLTAGHHPFVLPHPDDMELLESDPEKVRGLAYDLVYKGSELGSGSIRTHNPELQKRVLGLLGLSEEEIEQKFGFLLEALGSGAPPHGGVALGMDRIVKEFIGAESLREVIAFPKTTAARALFEGAPTPLAPADLAELHLRFLEGS